MRLHRYALLVAAILAIALCQVGAAMAGPFLVFEANSGRVINGERENEPWHPASLTKLMTAYVAFHAIKSGRFTPESQLAYSELAAAQPPSKIGMRVGSTLSLDLALQGLLIRSANDFAIAIAENIGGSVPRFVQMMNETARRLGMSGTYYANPHGLPDVRQVTTARDLAILTNAIINEFPEYKDYFSAHYVTVGGRRLSNRNGLLTRMKSADGMKTGYVCGSGYNLVASATRDGRRLVAVVLGARSGAGRTVQAEQLLEKGFLVKADGPRLRDLKPHSLADPVRPVDMTPEVCQWKPSYELTKAADLQDHGVALGRFASPAEANEMLNRWLLATRYIFYGGRGVITRVPYKSDYLVMIDQMNLEQSQALCSYLRANGAACQVMRPETFRALAAEAREEIAEAKDGGAKIEAASGPAKAPPGVNDSDE